MTCGLMSQETQALGYSPHQVRARFSLRVSGHRSILRGEPAPDMPDTYGASCCWDGGNVFPLGPGEERQRLGLSGAGRAM